MGFFRQCDVINVDGVGSGKGLDPRGVTVDPSARRSTSRPGGDDRIDPATPRSAAGDVRCVDVVRTQAGGTSSRADVERPATGDPSTSSAR